MSKNKTYRQLVGSQRWAALALKKKTEAGWQCFECGVVTKRLAVHHIIPLESARNDVEMERLCFLESNLRVLCYQCHASLHLMERCKNKQQMHGREKERVDKFFDKFINKSNNIQRKEGGDEKGE